MSMLRFGPLSYAFLQRPHLVPAAQQKKRAAVRKQQPFPLEEEILVMLREPVPGARPWPNAEA